jgi:hypothetical protein
MKIYFASPSGNDVNLLRIFGCENFLFSYHYLKKAEDKKVKELKKNCPDILLDSGAFSAKSLGEEINLKNYIEFIKKFGFENYASLDVIGDPKKTLENTLEMRKEGLEPLYTFHKGSSIADLEAALKHDFKYIALGGLVGNMSFAQEFLDKVWVFLLQNYPDIKVHGFGLTKIDMMKRYPWYSVDSSSWVSGRRFGDVFDERGNRLEQVKTLEEMNENKYFEFCTDGSMLVIKNVYSLLKMNKDILERKQTLNFEHLLAQQSFNFD